MCLGFDVKFLCQPKNSLLSFNEARNEIISEEDLLKKLKENRPLREKQVLTQRLLIYIWDIRFLINKLKPSRIWVMKFTFLIGDYTAMIGDPTGKRVQRVRRCPANRLKPMPNPSRTSI